MTVTRGDWAPALVDALKMPMSCETLIALQAWLAGENTEAAWNPLATTEPGFGETGDFNSAGVKDYATEADGIAATVATLTNGDYTPILTAMALRATADTIAQTIAQSPWGTGRIVAELVPQVRNNLGFYTSIPVAGPESVPVGTSVDSVPAPPASGAEAPPVVTTLSDPVATGAGQAVPLSSPAPAATETAATTTPEAPGTDVVLHVSLLPGERTVGITPAPVPGGYWVLTDEHVRCAGGAPFHGEPPTDGRNVSITAMGNGYAVVDEFGNVWCFGAAADYVNQAKAAGA